MSYNIIFEGIPMIGSCRGRNYEPCNCGNYYYEEFAGRCEPFNCWLTICTHCGKQHFIFLWEVFKIKKHNWNPRTHFLIEV